MEGVAAEAASLAGHLRLGKLIYLYDDNHITLAGGTDLDLHRGRRARASRPTAGTRVTVDGRQRPRGDRRARIEAARARNAQAVADRWCARTSATARPHKQDTFEAHGKPLGADEVAATKQALGWPTSRHVLRARRGARALPRRRSTRGAAAQQAWQQRFDAYATAYPELAAELQRAPGAASCPTAGTPTCRTSQPSDKRIATRVAAGQGAERARAEDCRSSSAARPTSTRRPTRRSRAAATSRPAGCGAGRRRARSAAGWSYAGRNMHFGVREHAMGATSTAWPRTAA